MKVCIYPGSFDPPTKGHEDLIRRGAALFDELVVCVMHNPAKKGVFTPSERVEMLEAVAREMPNVRVDKWDGLMVEYARQQGACAVMRGLRSGRDYEAELPLAQINAQLCPGLETVFLTARPEHVCVSSSAVRECAAFGADYSFLVPESILPLVKAGFEKK